jgi:hypothetical protein
MLLGDHYVEVAMQTFGLLKEMDGEKEPAGPPPAMATQSLSRRLSD